MGKGLFITLEGGEGAGKSTLARAIGAALGSRGRDVLVTREPGGAPGADAIRALLLTGAVERWSDIEEALLYCAARANHLRHGVRPALARGAVVVCDRYYDSTRAYQIAAGGLDPNLLDALNAMIAAPAPDLTIILDVDPGAGVERSGGARAGEDRFERKGAAYHARVRAAFLAIAAAEPQRCVVVNAGQPPEAVLAAALAAIEARL